MRWFQCLMLCFLGLALTGCGGAKSTSSTSPAAKTEPAKKELTNAEKLVGTWEVVKAAEWPPGCTMEFTKDGKMKVTGKVKDKEIVAQGTYTLDGDKIKTVGPGGEKETGRIMKLTATELAIENESGKVDELKKK